MPQESKEHIPKQMSAAKTVGLRGALLVMPVKRRFAAAFDMLY